MKYHIREVPELTTNGAKILLLIFFVSCKCMERTRANFCLCRAFTNFSHQWRNGNFQWRAYMCATGTRRRRKAACAGVGVGRGLPPLAGGGLPQKILKF